MSKAKNVKTHLIVNFLRYFEHAFNYKYEKSYDLLKNYVFVIISLYEEM